MCLLFYLDSAAAQSLFEHCTVQTWSVFVDTLVPEGTQSSLPNPNISVIIGFFQIFSNSVRSLSHETVRRRLFAHSVRIKREHPGWDSIDCQKRYRKKLRSRVVISIIPFAR